MTAESPPIDAALEAVRLAQFGTIDVLRRLQGEGFAALGLGPHECPYQIIASGAHWRLRDYGHRGASESILIVAAPIKRPYIWDLSTASSAIRYCLRQDLHVHLLEWMPATRATSTTGIDECTSALSECVATVSAEAQGKRPYLIGHSLGGTLAAIYATVASESIGGLVLLSSPLCFAAKESQFRDALVALVPNDLSHAEPFPGSLLSHMSAMAAPRTFFWSRLEDAALSLTDPRAMDLHARVERWALDEVPLPGKLVHQIIEWLYRENRLCRGTLEVRGRLAGPRLLSAPTLAVLNSADEVAPLASVKLFIDAIPKNLGRILQYPGEPGVCLQHLAVLLGRQAYSDVWPEIISWLRAQRSHSSH